MFLNIATHLNHNDLFSLKFFLVFFHLTVFEFVDGSWYGTDKLFIAQLIGKSFNLCLFLTEILNFCCHILMAFNTFNF